MSKGKTRLTQYLYKRILYLIATVITVAIVFLYDLTANPAFDTNLFNPAVWLLISSILLMNVTLETTLLRRSLIIAAVALLTLVTTFICTFLIIIPVVQLLFVAGVTGVCVYAGIVNSTMRYPGFAVNLLLILSMQDTNLRHAEAIALGAAIVLLAQIILLPFYVRDEYRRSLAQVFQRFGRLTTVLFSCLTTPEYPECVYLFERRVHKQKIKCLNLMSLAAVREQAAKPALKLSQQLQFLFEIIIDVGQIRRRVTDHTVFALCDQDLKKIETAIVSLFKAFASRAATLQLEKKILALDSQIEQFENIYEHVVKVAAREPVVFVLFISAVKVLSQHCKQLAGQGEHG